MGQLGWPFKSLYTGTQKQCLRVLQKVFTWMSFIHCYNEGYGDTNVCGGDSSGSYSDGRVCIASQIIDN